MAKTGTQMATNRSFRSLMNVDSFRDLFDLQRGINRLFDESYATPHQEAGLATWTPAVDVFENENEFLLKLELPEVKREDVKVNLHDNILSITGERRLENEEKRDGYHRIERTYGQFYRSFTLPPNVNTESINAQFKDGVLRLTMPKKEEAKPKQIEVNIA